MIRRPARWRDGVRTSILAVWLFSIVLMLLGIIEHEARGTAVLPTAGAVLFLGCFLVWVAVETLLVRAVPEQERPPELRGPIPGGMRWGNWYYNPGGPRWAAFDAKGHPIVNYGHPRSRPLLALRAGALVFGIAMIVGTAVAWLLE
jgi:hypothetical protein